MAWCIYEKNVSIIQVVPRGNGTAAIGGGYIRRAPAE